jgi:MFS family permease
MMADTGVRATTRTLAVVGGFFLLAFSYALNAMDRQVFYPLLPQISPDLGFSLTQGGLLATGFTLGMAVGGVPASILLDRVPRKHLIVVSIAIYSAGTLLTPLAVGFADMSFYRLLSGIGEGVQSASIAVTVASYFASHRTAALGSMGTTFGIGTFFGPIIGTAIASGVGSWRAPFVVFGCVGLATSVLILLFVSRRLTEAVARAGSGRPLADFDHVPESPYNRNTIALAVAVAAAGMVFYGFLGLFPTYLHDELHFTTGQGALATSFVGLGSAMSIFWGWVGDRVNTRLMLICAYLGAAVSALLLFNGPGTPLWEYVFAFTMGTTASGASYANSTSAIQRSVRPHRVGRAAGLFVISYYAAAAVSGYAFASLVSAFGWRQAAF